MEKCIIGALDLSFPSNWQLVSKIVGVDPAQDRFSSSDWSMQATNGKPSQAGANTIDVS